MTIQSILAEKTVSELGKKPCDYFLDELVAVLSNNKTAGYMINAKFYEQMITLIDSQSKMSKFRASQARLAQIADHRCANLLVASEEELGKFCE